MKTKTMPDPDNMNTRRAEWAEIALRAFAKQTGQSLNPDLGDVIADLIADLGHLCDRDGIDLAHMLDRATMHYSAETKGEGTQLA